MAKQDKSARDKQMAAYMKSNKIDRTTGRCALCYRVVSIDNPAKGTRFTHQCVSRED
jgi:hypothetical protein